MIPPICRWPVPVECATPPRPARSAHPSPEILPAPTTCIVSRRPGLRIHRRPPCCRIRPPNPDPAGRPAFGNAARSASTSPNPRERLPGVRARGLPDDLADPVRPGQDWSGDRIRVRNDPDPGAGPGPFGCQCHVGDGPRSRSGPRAGPGSLRPVRAGVRAARPGTAPRRRRRRRAGRRPRPPGSLASRPAGRASRPDAKEAR